MEVILRNVIKKDVTQVWLYSVGGMRLDFKGEVTIYYLPAQGSYVDVVFQSVEIMNKWMEEEEYTDTHTTHYIEFDTGKYENYMESGGPFWFDEIDPQTYFHQQLSVATGAGGGYHAGYLIEKRYVGCTFYIMFI